jgi:O-antigen ligase
MKKRKSTTAPPPSGPPPLPLVQQVARGLLLALAVALPLVAGKLADWQTGLVALVALLAAGLLVAGSLRPAGQGWDARRPEDWALAAFLALETVAVFWAPYAHGALLAVVQLLSYALCFWLARRLLAGAPWGDLLAGALTLGGSIVALLALREYLETWRSSGATDWRVFAGFFDPNLVAAYLLVALPAGVALLAKYWRAPVGTPLIPPPAGHRRDAGATGNPTGSPTELHHLLRPLALAAVVLMAVALPLTGSKGGALGAVAAALTFGWMAAAPGTPAGRRLRRWVLVLVVAAIALGLLAPPLRSRVAAAFTTQSNSTMFRYYTWIGMVKMIRARPLEGFGPGSFPYAYLPYAEAGFTRLGHETFLEVATEAGLPALAAFLALWALLLRDLRRRLSSEPPPRPSPRLRGQEGAGGEARLLPCAALAAVAGFLVHNLVDYSWYCPAVAASVFLLAGAALGSAVEVSGQTRRRWAVDRVLLFLVAGVALTVLLALFLTAQVRQAAAQAALDAGDPAGAVAAAQGALSLDPVDAESWEALAAGYEYQSAFPQAILARLQEARLRPTDPTNWRRLALLYGEENDTADALPTIARALRHNPRYVLGLADQARLAQQAGRPDLEAASWQQLADLYDTPFRKYAALYMADPTYLYAFDYFARRAEGQGDHPRALDYRRKMAPLLEEVLTQPPFEIALMRKVALLAEGDLENFGLMLPPTVQALRASGEKADAEEAGKLEKAGHTQN